MAKQHIERHQPSWQTGPRMTECGHSSPKVLTTTFGVGDFIDQAYRNANEAEVAGWCQTCTQTANRSALDPFWLWERRLGQRRMSGVTRRRQSSAEVTVSDRVVAEVAAVDALIGANQAVYTELVGALVGQDSETDDVPGRITLERNDRNELHCTTGPAWAWVGGVEIFALEGITVPRWAVMNPDPARILQELTNAEQRRVVFACYGWQRAASELGWRVLDDSGDPYTGVLYDLPRNCLRDGMGLSMNLLYGRNASPHPGGEYQWYGLPIPKDPMIDTAEKAQASLWRIPVEEWRRINVRT